MPLWSPGVACVALGVVFDSDVIGRLERSLWWLLCIVIIANALILLADIWRSKTSCSVERQ